MHNSGIALCINKSLLAPAKSSLYAARPTAGVLLSFPNRAEEEDYGNDFAEDDADNVADDVVDVKGTRRDELLDELLRHSQQNHKGHCKGDSAPE